jgi:3-oxoacyl-[acyl-carrier-protein] synthase-1
VSGAAIDIAGMGAVTPVGLSAPATCAALRAGVPRMIMFEGWTDDGPDPNPELVGGRVPTERLLGLIEEEWPGHERWNLTLPRPHVLIEPDAARLLTLAPPAAEEAWDAAGRPAGRAGIYLGLDEGDSATAVADAVGDRLGKTFDLVRADKLGRAAGLAALHRAARHLADGRVDVALVGGVDSQLRRAAIARQLERGTLHHDKNPAGVIPGEAAAFVVLQPAGMARPLARLSGSAVAEEPTAGSDSPNQGEGLTLAVRKARDRVRALEAWPRIICDLNGDRYRALEWTLVSVRALGDLPEGPASGPEWLPAEWIGDAGAASGIVSVVWAATALRNGYARAERALVWGASDGPLRAAAILSLED